MGITNSTKELNLQDMGTVSEEYAGTDGRTGYRIQSYGHRTDSGSFRQHVPKPA